MSWSKLLTTRQTWAYIAGRFLIDPVWWTFLFWLPDFFARRYGVDLRRIMARRWSPSIFMADVGSVLGGWGSSRLLKRGVALGTSRKLAMLACAIVVLPVALRHVCRRTCGWRWR